MTSRIVSTTMTIMENTVNLPLATKRLQSDQPKNPEEAMALEKFIYDVDGWMDVKHDNYFFLRWLRARGLNIERAKEMLLKHIEFRNTNQYLVELSTRSYIPPEFIENQIPTIHTGFDFDGRPVFFSRVGQTNLRKILENGQKDEMLKCFHFFLEHTVNASEVQRKQFGCTKSIAVIDFEGFSFSNAFHVQSVHTFIYAARVFEANYPELLYHAFAINANWVFSSLFKMMKPFFSTDTTDKIELYGNDSTKWKAGIRKYIPDEAIPIEYGGHGPSIFSKNVYPDIFNH